MKDQNSFKEINKKYKDTINKDIAKMEKDQLEFEKQNNYLMNEWRQYLYKYILLLGGILSFLVALSSTSLIKSSVDLSEFSIAVKYIFIALVSSILAIFYSIYKERANMWGQIYIKTISHDNFDKNIKVTSRIKKFLWVIFPFWFKDMDDMSNEAKEYAIKNKEWKFGYFYDFKRRYTDFRMFRYAFGLNGGVVWYGRIFGLLTIASVIAGLIGIYKLLILFST